jgi:transposase
VRADPSAAQVARVRRRGCKIRGPTQPRRQKCRAGIDYHVEIDKHYYSVPYTLMRPELWASYTASTVEVFHRGRRVAAHRRGPPNRGHTTLPDHMPSSHRRYADWTPERIKARPARSGLTLAHSSRSSCARSDTPSRAAPA